MRIETFAWITMSLLLSLTACKSDSTSSTSDVKAPSNLKAEPLEGGAHLTWQDDSDNEAEFMIDRKTATTDWKTVATVPFNTTQYHDADIAAGMTYMYRVMATPKQGDKGSYSNEVTFTNTAAGAAAAAAAGGGAAGHATASGGTTGAEATGGTAGTSNASGGAAGAAAGHGAAGTGAGAGAAGAGTAGGAAGGSAAGASGHDAHH